MTRRRRNAAGPHSEHSTDRHAEREDQRADEETEACGSSVAASEQAQKTQYDEPATEETVTGEDDSRLPFHTIVLCSVRQKAGTNGAT